MTDMTMTDATILASLLTELRLPSIARNWKRITEAANPTGEEYGEDRLAKRVLEGLNDQLSAKRLIDFIRKGVADFTERKFLDDDGTLFIVKAL